jgi:hypothetical protein
MKSQINQSKVNRKNGVYYAPGLTVSEPAGFQVSFPAKTEMQESQTTAA